MKDPSIDARGRTSGRAVLLAVGAAALLTGCATQEELVSAINAVNEDFGQEYERILRDEGTKTFVATKDEAFAAIQATMPELGMTVDTQDSTLGYLRASGTAPNPLSQAEWEQAGETDLPRMRRIVRQHAGLIGWFVPFEPEGLEILINATILEKAARLVDVSVTFRMHEIAPPKSGYPRRKYPPPTAMRMGISKFWRHFQRNLRMAKDSS